MALTCQSEKEASAMPSLSGYRNKRTRPRHKKKNCMLLLSSWWTQTRTSTYKELYAHLDHKSRWVWLANPKTKRLQCPLRVFRFTILCAEHDGREVMAETPSSVSRSSSAVRTSGRHSMYIMVTFRVHLGYFVKQQHGLDSTTLPDCTLCFCNINKLHMCFKIWVHRQTSKGKG